MKKIHMVDNLDMKKESDVARIKDNLRLKMQELKVTAKPLAKEAGLGETAVRDFLKNKDADIKIGTLMKICNTLNIEISSLIDNDGNVMHEKLSDVLYVKGQVAAGDWVDAYEYEQDDWIAFTGRNDITCNMMHRFGLRVIGDSMNLLYPEGTIVECVGVFGNVEIVSGKKVIVVRTRKDKSIEATVKEYHETKDGQWLLPRSNNPIHQAIDLNAPDDDIEEVKIIAVVVSSVRPE